MDSSWSANGALQSSAPPAWWVNVLFFPYSADHPWFEIAVVAASARSAGKTYEEAVADRWAFDVADSAESLRPLIVRDASDVEGVTGDVDFVFLRGGYEKG